MSSKKAERTEVVAISPPKFRTVVFRLVGTSPYMQARFSNKAAQAMKSGMLMGSQGKKGKKREARDFDGDYEGAFHVAQDGWVGVPASAIRNACIDVCRMVGFKMTHAKMSIFIEADGFDRVDGIPLVRLEAGEPERTEMITRNANGAPDIRVRPLWRTWALEVRVRYDEDQFSLSDVANLLGRAGVQVGIGEGRAFSKMSNGLGYGAFAVADGKAA